MLRHLRISALIAVALAGALAVTGCGGVPSNGVAKVGDTTITKAEFNHWLAAAAKQQSQTSPGQPAGATAVPDPPNFTKCVAAKQAPPLPKGGQKPPVAQLNAQGKQQY